MVLMVHPSFLDSSGVSVVVSGDRKIATDEGMADAL